MSSEAKGELADQSNSDQASLPLDDHAVLAFLTGQIDRGSELSLGSQLRGAIEYGVSRQLLPAGTRLPSIRTLAQATGLAAETVATAYRALQEAGTLVSYRGSGTFISDRNAASLRTDDRLWRIEKQIDGLLDLAARSGIAIVEVLNLVRARHAFLAASPSVRIVMVGIFEEATRAYADDIASYLRPGDVVTPLTIEQLRAERHPSARPDLYVALPSRLAEVREIVGESAPVTGIAVIPSERTRNFLASLNPNAHVALVARFASFIPLMRTSAQVFAPHLRRIDAMALDDPGLDALLAQADTVVYSTGAERVLARLPSTVMSAEYRHTPDPHAIRDALLPLIDGLRSSRRPA